MEQNSTRNSLRPLRLRISWTIRHIEGAMCDIKIYQKAHHFTKIIQSGSVFHTTLKTYGPFDL